MELMQQLKERTREHHDRAEGQQFQKLLANGELSQLLYARYLGQLWLIHERLETLMTAAAGASSGLQDIVKPEQLQVPFLERDLAYFKLSTSRIRPLASTEKFLQLLEQAARSNHFALIGAHYVLLGSKHGGKFIAHNLINKYNLQGGEGALYFDPYGTNFQQLWKDFVAAANRQEISDRDKEAAVEMASATFDAIARINADLMDEVSTAV